MGQKNCKQLESILKYVELNKTENNPLLGWASLCTGNKHFPNLNGLTQQKFTSSGH